MLRMNQVYVDADPRYVWVDSIGEWGRLIENEPEVAAIFGKFRIRAYISGDHYIDPRDLPKHERKALMTVFKENNLGN